MKSIKEFILESPLGYKAWSEPFNRPKVAAIARMLEKSGKNKANILDIGCGPGTNAAFFLDWDYLGVDLNTRYIESAKRKYPTLRFAVGDATKLDFGGEEFDVVLINSLMHHLNDAECAELLTGIKPILAERGVVIVQEPVTPEKSQTVMRFFMNQDRGDYFRPVEDWKDVFRAGELDIVSEDFYKMKLGGLITGWQMYSVLLTKKPDLAAKTGGGF